LLFLNQVAQAVKLAAGEILVADSWWEPTAQQIAEAKAAGYGAWLGYFAGSNVYHGWADATFQRVLAGGLKTGAYCSQGSDPAQIKAHAAALGIVALLDDESGLHADDSGTDPWLAASGAALYGGIAVQTTHRTHGHPGYIFAAYPGITETTSWPSYAAATSPRMPQGWQWADPAIDPKPFGSVDTSNFEAALLNAGAVPAPTPGGHQRMLVLTTSGQPALLVINGVAVGIPSAADLAALSTGGVPTVPVSGALFESVFSASAPQFNSVAPQLASLKEQIAALIAPSPGGGSDKVVFAGQTKYLMVPAGSDLLLYEPSDQTAPADYSYKVNAGTSLGAPVIGTLSPGVSWVRVPNPVPDPVFIEVTNTSQPGPGKFARIVASVSTPA
jgi:hypothetical protein